MPAIWQNPRFKQLTDPRNVVLYIFCIIVLAIAWSTVKAIDSNYQLQKKVSALKQENTVLQLQNQTSTLQNKYLESNEYLELAARQNLGLAAPGEKVMLIPKDVAMKYVDKSLIATSTASSKPTPKQSKYIKNLEDWRDLLLGRKIQED